jgi:2-methylcitrate dehydratase PrpD
MDRMNKTITTICNKSTTSAVQIQNLIGHRRNRGKKQKTTTTNKQTNKQTNKKQQQQTNKQTNKTHTHRPTSSDRQLSWLADTLR